MENDEMRQYVDKLRALFESAVEGLQWLPPTKTQQAADILTEHITAAAEGVLAIVDTISERVKATIETADKLARLAGTQQLDRDYNIRIAAELMAMFDRSESGLLELIMAATGHPEFLSEKEEYEAYIYSEDPDGDPLFVGLPRADNLAYTLADIAGLQGHARTRAAERATAEIKMRYEMQGGDGALISALLRIHQIHGSRL